MVLNQNSDKSLQRTQDGTMQHHRHLACTVFADIRGIKALWQGKIELDSAALPNPTNGVFQGKFDFGAVKRAFPRLQIPLQAFTVECLLQGVLSFVP